MGSLAGLAETDHTLALVGVNHLRALLGCQPCDAGSCYLESGMMRMLLLHQDAIAAYRVRVRSYWWQGKSYDEAQRLAFG